MPDKARLQVKGSADPERWDDVGAGAEGVPVPVAVESSALPTGAATAANQESIISLIEAVSVSNPHTGSEELRTFEENHLCTQNTSTTPLGAGATFTGVWEDCLNYQEVNVSIATDQDSATNGLVFQWSADGSTVGDTDTYSVYANAGTNYTPNPAFRYVRIVYTNGATPQGSFSIQTILRRSATGGSFHRIDSTLKDDSDGRLRIVVPKLRTAQDNYISQTATNNGNAKMSLEEYNGSIATGGLPVTDFFTEVAKGNVTDKHAFIVNKFGAAPDFDTGDGEVTMWDGAEDNTAWENMVYDYSATADIDSISSDNSGDTGITMELQGLDTNGDLVVQNATLDATDAQTRVAITTPLRRIFRAKNVSSTDLTGHVAVYPNTALTAGIPTDKSKIRALVHPENNQTEMCIYTVPTGYSAYLYRFYVDTAGASRTAEYLVKVRARPSGQVWQLKQKGVMSDSTGKVIDRRFDQPLKFSAGTDIELTAQILTSSITAANLIGGFDLVVVED